MLAEISLNNVRIYSNHGCLPEEAVIGSYYRVDLFVTTDISAAVKSDHLSDAVDYVYLHSIIYDEVKRRNSLLETVIQRLSERILKECPSISKIDLKLAKLNPPIEGEVGSVALRIIKER